MKMPKLLIPGITRPRWKCSTGSTTPSVPFAGASAAARRVCLSCPARTACLESGRWCTRTGASGPA